MAPYDAFISYSHAKDKPIAAALQGVIQRLGKPWHRRRALRVFRDDTSLSATPHLWPSIESALAQSRTMILLASPEAAASPWVAKEVLYWLDHKGADTLLIGLTDGELGWDNSAGDFTWRDDTPLPRVLAGRFRGEPKWVDLRAYRSDARTSDARFTELAADFAATVQGVPKEDLLSQEVRQQRRALALAWSAVVALLILAGAAGWQWNVALERERAAIQQRQIAQQQRERAERSLRVATETANSLVFDLAWELRDRAGMPRDLSRRILNHAQKLQRQLADSGENSPLLRRGEAIALSNLSLTHLALGDTTEALAAAQRAGSIFEEIAPIEKLAGIAPRDGLLQRDLSVNHNRIAGALEALGRADDALVEYRRGLAIAEKLVAIDPTNTLWQDDLSVSHGRIGNLLAATGRHGDALVAYNKSLAIIERLAASDPASTQWQRGKSVVYGHISGLLSTAGQAEDAIIQARASLAIAEQLAATDPDNTQWQHDLSIAYSRIGRLLAAAKQWDEALAQHRRAIAIYEKLAATDRSNVQMQRNLSLIHRDIGEVQQAAGRRDQAAQ
jgi:tetratricopeptide (TPR) repeat protein